MGWFMTKKYTLIYADPPWVYRDKAADGNRGAGFKYPVMSVLLRHWGKWSGWYLFLASVSAWLYLLALIFREGWIK